MHIVLNTYGTSLLVQNGIFKIVHKEGKQLISPEKVKSISMGKGAKISSDAALLAIEYQIDVMFTDKVGKPAGRVWSVKYGSISSILLKQFQFTVSEQAVKWIKDILREKLQNQQALLLSFMGNKPEAELKINNAVKKIDQLSQSIKSLKGDTVKDIASSLRGFEGTAGRMYFNLLNEFLPRPYQFKNRSLHPAMDLFNMLLNYGYGMLYGKIEGALIKAGIDPYLGVMHADNYNRPVLVFDIIEKYRVWVDYVVIQLSMQEVFDDDCYSVKEDGSFWLENMGKRILIQSVNDYFSELISIDGLSRSRETHIDLFAQNLATLFLNFKAN
jgi:CRISPR-associated protein Cas1